MKERLKQFSTWLKEKEVEAAFINSPDNIFYLTGFRSEPHERLLALIVFQEEEPFLVCPQMEVSDAKKAGWNYEIIGYTDTDNPWDMLKRKVEVRNAQIKNWAIEKEYMNIQRYENLSNLFSGSIFKSVDAVLNKLRMIKDESEIILLRKACELADFAVNVGMNEIAEGKTELDLLAAIEYEVKKKGITGMSFDTLVLTGANAASPHGSPGQTKIKKGHLVLFDLGVIYEGYCSDITRTIAFGDLTDKQEHIYETVLRAEQKAMDAVKPGTPACQLDQIARHTITDAGYGDYFPHRLGHGLGIGVHEYPSITSTNELILQEGMVFTIEPGVYIPGLAGVRIEDDVVVTKTGVEVLTKFPTSLQTV